MSAHRPRVVIIGAGFGGLAMALEVKRHGVHDVTIVEKASDIGGVWRENTYPGAACDLPSPYYSFSFAPNPTWPTRFSTQADIHDYMRRIVTEYGLEPHIRFNTEVTACRFDKGWHVETAAGDILDADVLVPAMGQLSRPALPTIPGRETFAGIAFHSASWRHDVDLTGKRVAVIGTGASAIQFIPQIQPQVGRLTVFQRTAPYVAPKPDRRYHPIHHWLFRHFPPARVAARGAWWLLCEVTTLGLIGNKTINRMLTWITLTHLRHNVHDPQLRAKLTPDYPIGCKRVLVANNYYPALSQPNVHVETARIAEITQTGVRTVDGVDHPADVIVYGTGFTTTEFLAPVKITGLGGRHLQDAWAGGVRAYLGIAVPGFPNLFLMYGPNTNLGAGSIIYMLERQARYIRQLVEHTNGGYLHVRADVEQRYDDEIQNRLAGSVWAGCSSWYRHDNGRISANWPGRVAEYNRRTRRVNLADYESIPLTAA
jgi:cation diffusion facilitator CzcD-associated flavoprotein CzcO